MSMTTEEMKAKMNRVQSGRKAQNFQSSKMNLNNDATQFKDVANSDFEKRRNKEISIMQKIVLGKTPANILKTTSERNGATDITFTTLDGKVDTSKAVEKQRMTAESFIKTVMTIRNLSGQNVMIPESEIGKMGLELAPYAKPFYDKDNHKFYELSVTRRPSSEKGKRLKFYANNKVSQAVVDKLNAPAANPKDGVDPSVKSALDICEKLGALTGISLQPNDKVNSFMPSTLGKVSKKAKDALSTLTLNKWQSKKFVPQSGKLYMNTKGMNATDVLTNYISGCAMRSFNTNIDTFLNVVKSDRGFQSGAVNDKNARIEDYKKNYELIKYKLHNICTDLIASEMCKLIPDTSAEERLALSESYLTSAMQRMNDLGKYLDDPYVMKFISKTVTDSVSRYNANFAFSTKQIVEANCKVCGYKNMFKVGNRETAIFGEYEVPSNGDFQFSSFAGRETNKEATTPQTVDNENTTATFGASFQQQNKNAASVNSNSTSAEDKVTNTSNNVEGKTNDNAERDEVVVSYTADGRRVYNLKEQDNVIIKGPVQKTLDDDFNVVETEINKDNSDFIVDQKHNTLATENEKDKYIYEALSPEGKEIHDKFPEDFKSVSPTNNATQYILSKNYPDGTEIEITEEHKMIIDHKNKDKFRYEFYQNGWDRHMEEETARRQAEETERFNKMNKNFSSTPVDMPPSERSEGNEQVMDENMINKMFSNVERGPAVRIIQGQKKETKTEKTDIMNRIIRPERKTTNNGVIVEESSSSDGKKIDDKGKEEDKGKEHRESETHSEKLNENENIENVTPVSDFEKDEKAKKEKEKVDFTIDEKLGESIKYYNAAFDEMTRSSDVAQKDEVPQNSDTEPEEEKSNREKLEIGNGIIKKGDGTEKSGITPDPIFSGSIKTFGERTDDSIKKSLAKYVSGLTAKALSEKSLNDKKRAIEKAGTSSAATERAQAISASQNAVTILYNNAHSGKTSKQATEIIDKANRVGNNAEVIEAATLKELDNFADNEVEKAFKAYEANKNNHPEWGACKTPASFMNYYYKNVVGAETKYGNDIKKQVKMTCRKMDAAVAADVSLTRDGANYRMYDTTTFIEKDEKSNLAELNAYKVRKIVPRENADPQLETLTVYSDNDDLVENSEFDAQFRDAFKDEESLKDNNGYIGKGTKGMSKPIVFPRKVVALRRAKMLQASKNDRQ